MLLVLVVAIEEDFNSDPLVEAVAELAVDLAELFFEFDPLDFVARVLDVELVVVLAFETLVFDFP